MNDFMKTILSAVKTWTKGEIKDSVADWDQNDPTKSNYVENRTHYDSREEREVCITFDGNLEGREYIETPFGAYLVKISDMVPTVDEFLGGKVFIKAPDGTIEYAATDLEGEMSPDGTMYTWGGIGTVLLVYSDISSPVAVTKGVWVAVAYNTENGAASYVSSISYTIHSGELKKLDAKYLPMESLNESFNKYDLVFRVHSQEIIGGSVDRVWEKLNSGHPPIIILYGGIGSDGGMKHVMNIPTAIYEWSDDNNIYFGVDFDATTFGFKNHEGNLRAVFNSHGFEYVTEL